MIKKYQPTILLVMDGFGLAPKGPGNAIELAKKPNFDSLWKKYPHAKLCASESCVGLPDGLAGNSEAGHMNIGAGRVVFQDNVIINRAIADGSFYQNISFKYVNDHIIANKSRLHLMGMVSDGDSPHSSLSHLVALVEWARQQKIEKVFLHLFTDGRDSAQHSSHRIIHELLTKLEKLNHGYKGWELVTLLGRFYAMDRAKNWDRTKKAYDCLVGGKGLKFTYYKDAIEHAYNSELTDEFIEPSIIDRGRSDFSESRIKNDDAVIFFNLRSDRARQLTKAFVQKRFNAENPGSFKRSKSLRNVLFCAFTYFGPDLSSELITAFPGAELLGTLPFVMNNYKQLYIAESEKFAHVTYFINGGYPHEVFDETRVLIPSDKVRNFALKPEMSVYTITDYILKAIKAKKFDFIVVNFANPDIVGHTGNLKATIKAIEHVDICLGKLMKAVTSLKGVMFVTADHGNAEKMIDEKTGEVFTEHTTNPVPFVIMHSKTKKVHLHDGSLGDIAPTIYDFMEIKQPATVVGQSLINHPPAQAGK